MPEVRKLWQNQELLSDHYLKARLSKNDWWPDDETARPIWEFCRDLYNKRYLALAKNNEAFTRQELIDKVLEKLGFAWSDNLSLPRNGPDCKGNLVSEASEGAPGIRSQKAEDPSSIAALRRVDRKQKAEKCLARAGDGRAGSQKAEGRMLGAKPSDSQPKATPKPHQSHPKARKPEDLKRLRCVSPRLPGSPLGRGEAEMLLGFR